MRCLQAGQAALSTVTLPLACFQPAAALPSVQSDRVAGVAFGPATVGVGVGVGGVDDPDPAHADTAVHARPWPGRASAIPASDRPELAANSRAVEREMKQ
jgi:hypothetical protein